MVLPYFVDSRHDDLRGVMVAYGSPPTRGVGAVVYNLTTSAGTIVLIDAMLAAVFALVVVLILEGSLALGAITAVLVGLLTLVLLAFATFSYYRRVQASIAVVFPMAGDDAREEAPRNPSAGGSVDA